MEINSDEIISSKFVFISKCTGTNITIKGKCSSIKISDCVNCNIMFDNVISSCEVVNSRKINV